MSPTNTATKDFYSVTYPKKGAKQSRPAALNDPRVEVTSDLPTAAPDPSDMRSDRTYPGVRANAIYGKLYQREKSLYGVDGANDHGQTNGMGKK